VGDGIEVVVGIDNGMSVVVDDDDDTNSLVVMLLMGFVISIGANEVKGEAARMY
jgi:hypothetical protein